jgi:hypothetical protein
MKVVCWIRLAGVLVLATAVAVVTAGCSREKPPVVSGTVTYDGQPVPFGQVLIYNDDIVVAEAGIGPDGVFNLNTAKIPDGDLKVAVVTLKQFPSERVGVPPGARAHEEPPQGPDAYPHQPMPKKTSPRLPTPGAVPGSKEVEPPPGARTAPRPEKDKEESVSSRRPLTTQEIPPPLPGREFIEVRDLPPEAQKQKATLQAIQKKYGSPSDSGLTFNKSTNAQTFDLPLQP